MDEKPNVPCVTIQPATISVALPDGHVVELTIEAAQHLHGALSSALRSIGQPVRAVPNAPNERRAGPRTARPNGATQGVLQALRDAPDGLMAIQLRTAVPYVSRQQIHNALQRFILQGGVRAEKDVSGRQRYVLVPANLPAYWRADLEIP